jgi:hypothetical protein
MLIRCIESGVKRIIVAGGRRLGSDGAIGAGLELLDALLGFGEEVAAVGYQLHALFVFADGVFEADLAGLDLLDEGFELFEAFFECWFFGHVCLVGKAPKGRAIEAQGNALGSVIVDSAQP